MRIIELVYDEYKKAIGGIETEEIEPNMKFEIKKEEIDKIFNIIKKIEKKEIKPTQKIEKGNVYEYPDKNFPILFTILKKEEDIYLALVMTPFWQLASDKALIVHFEHPLSSKFAVLPIILNLDEDFIKNETTFVGKLKDEDIKTLEDFYEGKIEELPKEKRGLSYIEDKNYFQERFLQDEIKRTFKLQAFLKSPDFWEEETIIELPPERLEKQLLTAGEEKTVYRNKDFILFYDVDKNEIELEPNKDFVGKSTVLKIFDDIYEFEKLPEIVKISIPEEFKGKINIDYIGKNIKLELKNV